MLTRIWSNWNFIQGWLLTIWSESQAHPIAEVGWEWGVGEVSRSFCLCGSAGPSLGQWSLQLGRRSRVLCGGKKRMMDLLGIPLQLLMKTSESNFVLFCFFYFPPLQISYKFFLWLILTSTRLKKVFWETVRSSRKLTIQLFNAFCNKNLTIYEFEKEFIHVYV